MKTTIVIMILIAASNRGSSPAAAHATFQLIRHDDHFHIGPQQRDTPEDGKPASCDNYKQTPVAHRCHCARDEQECHGGMPPKAPDVSMDSHCLTYCRQQNCKCIGHGCSS
jgi:hypothetical protein